MVDPVDSKAVVLDIGGKKRAFDIDDPKLPGWVDDNAFSSGGYPYPDKLDKEVFAKTLEDLQAELVKVQFWLQKTGGRVMALLEGRDAAGKGGAIHDILAYMNPRNAHVVALTKPTETERGQWYYQRYIAHFPTAGDFVLFDRSWYNRAGVEPVMGFCTPEEYERFLAQTPRFEKMLVQDGFFFFKFWLDIGREMQLKRFHDRAHDRLKTWKLSPMDIAALNKWDDYSQKRDRMLKETDTDHAPWTVVRANDKRRARIEIIRSILTALDYEGKDKSVVGTIDSRIVCSGHAFLD
ncbi:polyphosphate kinase 2, PA0141 family [Rhizobium sp. RU20A]|uniref:polyphosphate kinase 2 n=1 Tax=Rhizobium sp. RU20A TaxID=1907412 RepID=UPI0009566F06|nr:polyphosphate kinase 2 [Rhizobium sp. RU20A]SIQ62215.1 polyphosphate kinase 2, PA0141 family [Rhizobium sp. RU20A]